MGLRDGNGACGQRHHEPAAAPHRIAHSCKRSRIMNRDRKSGARTWAILASLINTAKLNDLDPQTYLADVLARMISGRTPVSRLDELLAWNWKAARDALAPAAA